MTGGPLLAGILTALAVLILFVGLWRIAARTPDPLEARLKQYGASPEAEASADGKARRSLLRRAGKPGGPVARLADALTRADMPFTVAEFVLAVVGLVALGFLVGWWRGGLAFAALLAFLMAIAPFVYLSTRAGRRRQAFTTQLPDTLALLIGALRAGYGITQALDMLVARLPQPSSVEFGRAMRAVNLGLPVNRALSDMADRVDSDDLYLVVTAMNVQQEVGGNLAQVLETIAETVRERIRVKREIRVFTAQQRMTGIILGALPIAAVLMLGGANREYMSGLFSTTLGRMMVVVAVILQVIGFLVIRKIVDIEV